MSERPPPMPLGHSHLSLAAAHEGSDPVAKTMAHSVVALRALVDCRHIAFHWVNQRLECSHDDCSVAWSAAADGADSNEIRRCSRTRDAALTSIVRCMADADVGVLGVRHLVGGGAGRIDRLSRYLSDILGVVVVGLMLVRVEGRISGLIVLGADGPTDGLSRTEIALLRAVHPLVQTAFGLACVVAQQARKPVDTQLLTPREREIASLLADGHSNAEISSALTIAPATTKTHVQHLLAKLGVANRSQAAVHLRDAGF